MSEECAVMNGGRENSFFLWRNFDLKSRQPITAMPHSLRPFKYSTPRTNCFPVRSKVPRQWSAAPGVPYRDRWRFFSLTRNRTRLQSARLSNRLITTSNQVFCFRHWSFDGLASPTRPNIITVALVIMMLHCCLEASGYLGRLGMSNVWRIFTHKSSSSMA